MIHEGERNRKEKLKLINDLKKSAIKDEKKQAKRCKTLFVCSQCGLRISYEEKKKKTASARMSYRYDDYRIYFEDQPNFKPFENNYKNTKCNWGASCNYICLDCGNYIENKEKGCEKCGDGNIVSGKELAGKPCPVCKTPLNEGIILHGFEAYLGKDIEIDNKWFKIYRERYNVEKPIPKNYTDEEIAEIKRRENLQKIFYDDKFILNNLHNALRFEFQDSFMTGSFNCILEWDDGSNGKLTLFNMFNDVWVEKIIEWQEIKKTIDLLDSYNFFEKSFYKKTLGFDGYTFCLEVKIGKKYKELSIWGVEKGILYDIGMMLLKFAGKSFKELYQYAW